MHSRIGEINIICTDLDRSLRFYRDVMGFEAVTQEGPAWHMACGGVKFLLLAVADEPAADEAYCARAGFSADVLVSDLKQAYEHCLANGVRMVSEFEPNDDRFMIRDPDGLVWEVIQG